MDESCKITLQGGLGPLLYYQVMKEDDVLNNIKKFSNPNFVKKNYPEDYGLIMKCNGSKFGERLYNYIHPNKVHNCVVCGKPTTFNSIERGYRRCCSSKCSANDPTRKAKVKATCLKKYGAENPLQVEEIQLKSKATCLKKYGTEYAVASDAVRQKAKQTNLKRYGTESSFASDIVKQKIKQTNLKRYGVENSGGAPIARQKAMETCLKRYGDKNYNNRKKSNDTYLSTLQITKPFVLKYTEDMEWVCKCPHPECNKCEEKQYIIPSGIYYDRNKYNRETCTILHPINDNESWPEKEIREYIVSLGFECEKNTNILNGKELDIYIPEKKIAIEFNGCYWHSSKHKTPSYHYDKWKTCFDAGIQLITIWEDWWVNDKEKCKNLIRSKLGIYKERLYARKCIVKEISVKDSKDFCNKFHIQGASPASIHIGLFHGEELVSVMTFAKQRQGIGNGKIKPWELVRYCSGTNHVIGGAGKLFKYFIRKYNPEQIVSYSSNDISLGGVYKALGFQFKRQNKSSYWYIGYDMKRYHRYSFNKFHLKKMGYDTEHLTEAQIMNELPYLKIYDSGTTTWEWKSLI